jgi:hypothetical protein
VRRYRKKRYAGTGAGGNKKQEHEVSSSEKPEERRYKNKR